MCALLFRDIFRKSPVEEWWRRNPTPQPRCPSSRPPDPLLPFTILTLHSSCKAIMYYLPNHILLLLHALPSSCNSSLRTARFLPGFELAPRRDTCGNFVLYMSRFIRTILLAEQHCEFPQSGYPINCVANLTISFRSASLQRQKQCDTLAYGQGKESFDEIIVRASPVLYTKYAE